MPKVVFKQHALTVSFHFSFTAGDLNYRTADFLDPEGVLDRVHAACISERAAAEAFDFPRTEHSAWREKRWEQLTSVATKGAQSGSGPLFDRSEVDRWAPLLEHDELRRALKAGVAFAGFSEASITFPPSFRRRRGSAGICGDYSTRDLLANAYVVDLAKEKEKGTIEDDDADDDEMEVSSDGNHTAALAVDTAPPIFELPIEESEVHPGNFRSKHARPPSYTDR